MNSVRNDRAEYEWLRFQTYMNRINAELTEIRLAQLRLELNVAKEKQMLLELVASDFASKAPTWSMDLIDRNWEELRGKKQLIHDASVVVEAAEAALVDTNKIRSFCLREGDEYRKTHLPHDGEVLPSWEQLFPEPVTPRASLELGTDV